MMNVSLSGVSSFLPLIVKSFGYSNVTTQLLTVPVYVAAGIATIAFACVSDKLRKRGVLLAVSFSIASLGWLLLLVSKSQALSLAACFLTSIGTYPAVVLIQSWQASNMIGYTKRYVSTVYRVRFRNTDSMAMITGLAGLPLSWSSDKRSLSCRSKSSATSPTTIQAKVSLLQAPQQQLWSLLSFNCI